MNFNNWILSWSRGALTPFCVGSVIVLQGSMTAIASGTPLPPSQRPNIVLMMADDLGYGNLGCYGTDKILTPNIDRLAKEGVRFTDAHASAAVCQPTRYGILTGRYYWRSSWGRIQSGSYFRDNEVLLPKLFQQAGYNTAMFGKWHLGFGLTKRGEGTDWNRELKPGPNEAGFDTWFGMPNSHAQPPFIFIENHWVYKHDPNDPIRVVTGAEAATNHFGFHGGSLGGKAAHAACEMDRLDLIMAERASAWIAKQDKHKPFFLYVPFFAPHVPLAVASEFQGTSPLAKSLRQRSNAARTADYCQQLDTAAGLVMAALRQHGFDTNTLVIFTSDNGNLNSGDNMNAGFRSNGDFLGQKADTWEGGHRIPFIARWPGHIPQGKVSDKLLSLTDLYNTFLAAAHITPPAGAGPDSLNQLPLLTNPDKAAPIRFSMMYKGKGAALRVGDWVYLPYQGGGGLFGEGYMAKLGYKNSDYDEDNKLHSDAPPAQLYNLKDDPSQAVNLYGKYPELVKHMDAVLTQAFRESPSNKPLEQYLGTLPPDVQIQMGLKKGRN
jgi:arylsulfatase A